MGFFSALVGGVVGFFVGGPVGAVIGAGLGATKVGEKVVNTVLDFVTQPFMPKIPDVSADSAERQQGFELQREGSDKSIPVVYGYRKVGGVVTFAETGATDNKYLFVAYVFSEGLVEGLREIFIDDNPLPADIIPRLNAGEIVDVTSGKYKDRVQLSWSPGFYADNSGIGQAISVARGLINSTFFTLSPSFKPNMTYNGLAVLFARFEYKKIVTQADSDANPFNGQIPVVQVSMLGKRVASLLVDTTETLDYDRTEVRYSTNPAECLLDYLRNPRYGKGLKNEDIDWASWKIAARKCNQTVTYVASGISGPILTMNGVVDTSATLMNNTKLMLQNFRAYMPYVQGKYRLKIEDAGNPTDITSGAAVINMSFTKDDIVSDITYGGIDRSSKYNVVSVTYIDPDQQWSAQSVIYPETEAERQVYIDRDGGRENKYEVTYGFVTNYAIAKDMARLIFNKQRRQETCVFTATSKALELEPGDCVRIQSNILDFGTDPWRVVSIKINNDMTVDLGCVRNPDDIYPYARVGEEDIVLPPYIPKGSLIYYPSSQNLPPLGLVPPQYAVFPTVVVPSTTNPPPTDPLGPSGGGVGGGSGGSSTATTNPVDTTNNTATPPPPPPPFSAILKLKSSKAVLQSTGGYVYNLVFTQPSDAMYSKSTIWWRVAYQPSASWSNGIDLTTVPGPGGDIPWSIGPLPAGQYEFIVRSFSENGDGSNRSLKGQISVAPNAAELNPNLTGIASASEISTAAGWTLPGGDVVVAPRYDDVIDKFEIRPKLVGGAIQDPRRMTVSINQIESTLGRNMNFGIKGVRIYWKYSTETYYNIEDFDFETLGNPYYPGKPLTFDLAGDFGVPGTAQQYTFAAKLLYKDGKDATKMLAPANAPVETYIGRNDFIAYGTTAGAAANKQSLDIPATLVLQDVSADPNKAASSGSKFTPTIDLIKANPTTSLLYWTFSPPATLITKFRGVKIRYREIIPGSKTEFTEIPIGPRLDEVTGKISYTLNQSTYSHTKSYEFAITYQYAGASGATDCEQTLYAKGVNIPFSDYRTNLYDAFNFSLVDTTVALGNLVTTFPATPTVVASSWSKIQKRPAAITGQISGLQPFTSADSADVYRANASTYHINRWYRLKFSAPSGYNQVVVYRRVYNSSAAQLTSVGATARFYGLGAWEKKVITMPSADADGFYTINVRGPIDPFLFDTAYEKTAGRTLYQNYYGPSGKYPNGGFITDVYPYYGTGNTQNTGTVTRWVEFLIVLANSGVEATKALRLRDFYAATSGADFKTQVEGFGAANVVNNDIVNISDYNNFTNGYKRNINEAITNVPNAALHCGCNPIYPPNSPGVPNSTNQGALYTVFLGNAEDGTTIH